MFLHQDGSHLIFTIQHLNSDGKWTFSNFDYFGCPPGFTASGGCWQKTGIHGTFDQQEAKEALKWLKKRNLEWRKEGGKFRLVVLSVAQQTIVLGE